MLIDSYNRPIRYLRISVTDRCNLRCVYCMPACGIEQKEHEAILRYEEIVRVVEIAVAHGINSVRITGGEPLVRKGVVELVRMLAQIEGLEDLSMTTNGILLEEFAQPLAEAGLKRVNVSLDTLDREKFRRITRGGKLQKVWRGILAAEQAGLMPLKINTVVMRGVNEDEILDLARLSLDHPWHIRFIEWMPINYLPNLDFKELEQESFFVPVEIIYQKLIGLNLEPVDGDRGYGPARLFRPQNGIGLIGIIAAVSEHFCDRCNRLRLTADGKLRPCLFSNEEIDLFSALRSGDEILPLFLKAIKQKPGGHRLGIQPYHSSRNMNEIGG